MKTITIQLGERSYNIHAGEGILDNAGEIIAGSCKGRAAAVITNPRIGNLYASRLVQSLEKAGISAQVITIQPGERYKTLKTVERIYEYFLDQKLDRGGMAIGLGGGIVGDVTGFAAATYLRGIDFIQIPTSLLAQVDASVGGKTGVNLTRGKNLVGAFHQPKAVIIDISVLKTLPVREFRSGLAEVIKHGIIRDREYFDFIKNNLDAIKHLETAALEQTIVRSCEIKADVVNQDERESGLRRILNFGHTVGHVIERLTAYQYKHGEAVSIGMVTAALAAQENGTADPGLADKVADIIKSAGLPYKIPEGIGNQDIISAMGLDKKVTHGKLHAVLVDNIGSAYVTKDLPQDAWIKAFEKQSRL